MPAVIKRRLLRGEVTYSDVKGEEVNILHELGYFEKQSQFITALARRDDWVKSVVAHHLNIDPSRCHIADSATWLKGSFNLCIPVTIQDRIRYQLGNRVKLILNTLHQQFDEPHSYTDK
ncbi:hypothetical protein TEQG_02491 [Trichophyton equinum CBS 127.97]|uniref:Uncharacterized protein n=1 Tax=Trichophyton equinum (strain ATCC MYA-4606 / CBS 127.97) TaxID=559882 RepID=F2PNJ2_TRIEC|nr:hypothetical protein TEQG_02491 [Trichophyton equinum CBS 127.97]